MDSTLLVLLVTFLAVVSAEDCKTCSPYEAIYNDVFKKYNKHVIPILVSDEAKAVEVRVDISILDILEYNQVTGYGVFIVWEKMAWPDHRLRWDPNFFNGVKSIRVPSDHLWIPDVVLYKSDLSRDIVKDNYAVLSHTGELLYIYQAWRSVPCHHNGTRKDGLLICTFKYGSWTYDGSQIDLQRYHDSDNDTFAYFETSLPYKADHAKSIRKANYYPCCPDEPYVDITLTAYFKAIQKPCDSWWGFGCE